MEKYLKGIYLQKLNTDEIKDVLKNYNIINLPKQPSSLNKQFAQERIRSIYDWALYVVLTQGHCFLLNQYHQEFVEPSIYFDDMIMLLYLYEINKREPLPISKTNISADKSQDFYIIEQSGYGNILGLRRENDKFVKFQAKKRTEIPDEPIQIERRKNIVKTNIPYVCKDILSALLLSIKFGDPFIFKIEKEQYSSFSTMDSPEQLTEQMLLEYKIPIHIFTDELQLLLNQLTEGAKSTYLLTGLKKELENYLHQPVINENFSIDDMYKFLERYYTRLNDKEKPELLDLTCVQRANRYLSEILFGYKYDEDVYDFLKELSDKYNIDRTIINAFLPVIYLISESPICFARTEHMKQSLTKYLHILKKNIPQEAIHIKDMSQENIPQKDFLLKKERKTCMKIYKRENNFMRNFLPALFYCFLYYFETNEYFNPTLAPEKDFIKIIEPFVKKIPSDFEMPDKSSFKKWASDLIIQDLWSRRKREYFYPLKHDPKKALF